MPHSQPAPCVMVYLEQSSAAAIAAAPLPRLPLPRSVSAFHLSVHGCTPAARSWVFAVQRRSTPQEWEFWSWPASLVQCMDFFN